MELSNPRARFLHSLRPALTIGLDAVTCIPRGLRRPVTEEAVRHFGDLAAAPRYLLQAFPRVFGGSRPHLADAHGAVEAILCGSFLPLPFSIDATRGRRFEIAHEDSHFFQDRHSSFSL